MSDPELIIRQVQSILEDVKETLPAENVTDATELLEHEEWGEALSLICTQLYEYEIPVNHELYDRIASVGERMQLPPKEWELLRELIS